MCIICPYEIINLNFDDYFVLDYYFGRNRVRSDGSKVHTYQPGTVDKYFSLLHLVRSDDMIFFRPFWLEKFILELSKYINVQIGTLPSACELNHKTSLHSIFFQLRSKH